MELLLQSAFIVLDLEPCLGLLRAGSRPGGSVVPWADLPAFLQDLLGSAAKALCPSVSSSCAGAVPGDAVEERDSERCLRKASSFPDLECVCELCSGKLLLKEFQAAALRL